MLVGKRIGDLHELGQLDRVRRGAGTAGLKGARCRICDMFLMAEPRQYPSITREMLTHFGESTFFPSQHLHTVSTAPTSPQNLLTSET